MPRQRRGATAPTRHAPARPTVAPTKPPQQSARNISTSTHAAVATQQPGPPAQTGKSPGLFGQMASTAAYEHSILYLPDSLLCLFSSWTEFHLRLEF